MITIRNLLTLFLLMSSFILISQEFELDEAYLESLPEGVRNDLEEKMKSQIEMEKPQYRRASTMLDKPEEPDEINLRKAKRFGDAIFDVMQSSFMPINEPNLDSSYVLDFGDTLKLQLSGNENSIEDLVIERDGSINIPVIGKLFVSGLSLESASDLIKENINNAFIGTNAFVSLTNIRDIQVLISGNAYNPGIYTLNGNSNVLHALSMAGGVDNNGSYRRIDVIRDGSIVESIDLYDVFISGIGNFNKRLRTGDSIYVRPAQNLVNVSTGVNRPAMYELLDDETFKDLIEYANGFKSSADQSYLAVERLDGLNVDLIKFDNVDSLFKTKINDGDTLFIKEFVYRSVSIEGAVEVPGQYIIQEGETLRGLINRAGGYKSNSYPFGGFLDNIKTAEINETARDKLYNQFLENLLLKTSFAENPSLPLILEELRNTEVSGRVMAEFDIDKITEDSQLDTTLEDGDKILIPYVTQQVYIYGEINNSGTIRYEPGKSLNHYVNNAGGFKASTDTKNIFVIYPNGRTEQLANLNRFSALSSSNDVDIYPGSIIFVPRKSNLSDPLQVASIWAPIVSSIALSITSLSVLENN